MTDATPSDTGDSQRLEGVIAACLRAAELGIPVDRVELLSRYPELAEHLRSFFTVQDQGEIPTPHLPTLSMEDNPAAMGAAATMAHPVGGNAETVAAPSQFPGWAAPTAKNTSPEANAPDHG